MVVKQEFIAKIDKLEAAYHRLERHNTKLIQQNRKLAQGSRQGSADALGGLTSLVAGYLSVQQAISFTTKLLREEADAHRELAAAQRQAAPGLGSLAQLADTPKEMKRLTDAARSLFRQGAASDLNAAAQLVFSLESAGALGEKDMFGQLASTKVLGDPATAVKATTALQTAMGKGETGTLRQILSKGFAASKYSPATLEELLQASAVSGGAARQLGISDEEVLGATAVLSKTGGADIAGTQVNSLLRSLIKHGGFKGKGLMGSVADLQAMGMDDAAMQEFLGRKEAAAGFNVLSLQAQTVKQATAKVTAAQTEDLVARKLGLARGVPEVSAAEGVGAAGAEAELADSRSGRLENVAQILLAKSRTRMSEAGWSNARRRMGIAQDETAAWLEGNEWYIRNRILHQSRDTQRQAIQALGADDPIWQSVEREAGERGESGLLQLRELERIRAAIERQEQNAAGNNGKVKEQLTVGGE